MHRKYTWLCIYGNRKGRKPGSITFSVGIQNDGTVNGYSITSISETPGLGMKAQEEDFYGQFENKK